VESEIRISVGNLSWGENCLLNEGDDLFLGFIAVKEVYTC